MRKILVADDSLTIQKVIRLALSQDGYEIETLGDGNALLQRLPVFRPDIVMVDISLPGKTAFDARREALRNPDLAHTRWVLMSSAFDQVPDQTVQDLKFHGRLIKPFDPTYLRKVLNEASGTVAQPPAGPKPRGAVIPPAIPSAPTVPSSSADPTPPPMTPTLPPSFGSSSGLTGLVELEDPTLGKDLWTEATGFGTSPFSPPKSPAVRAPEIKPVAPLPTPNNNEDDVIRLTESTVRMSGLDHYQWNVHEPATESLGPKLAEPAPSPPPAPTLSLPPLHEAPPQPVAPPVGPVASPPSGPPLGQAQLQQLVEREISSQIQRITREMLPDIAERILKEEIHKLLANPPG